MNRMRLCRVCVWGAAGLLVGLLLLSTMLPEPQAPAEASTGTARVSGPFSLTSHKGERINNQSLAGWTYFVFFGFTHCPEICPTTLFELTDPMSALGADADKFEALFATIDPERDTQALLASYTTSFESRITALRGSSEETETTLKTFSAYATKVPLEDGKYTMDHTTGVYLVRGDGSFGGTLDIHRPRDIKLQKLHRLASS